MDEYTVSEEELFPCPLIKRDISLGYCYEIGLLGNGSAQSTEEYFVNSLGFKELVFATIKRLGKEASRQICLKCTMEKYE